MQASATVYQVTIDHDAETSEHYTTTQETAYALVTDELTDPTPGVCRVEIRPVMRETVTEAIMDLGTHYGAGR